MSWYKDWFSSEHYLKVYSHRDLTEAERLVEFIIKKTQPEEDASVLDMACGAGRHAIAFAKKGFSVTAVDLSELLIREAMKNSEQNNVQIDFVVSDILNFDTVNRFDLIANLFTSFGYFENDDDNYGVIQKSYSLLKKGGYFVLDYFNKNFLINNIIPTTVLSENGKRITQNRLIKDQRVVKNITIENNENTSVFYESVRLYSCEEILAYFDKAGFTNLSLLGDYQGSEHNKDSSQRLIVFGQK